MSARSDVGVRRGKEGLPLRCFATAVLALSLATTIQGGSSAASERTFQVIVHQDVQGTQIPRADLSAIFLKDALRWGDGRRVEPVDQSLRSPVRKDFSEAVLHKSVDGIQLLWSRKVTRGVMPPAVKSTDEEVIAHVAETEGAIGYVSAGLPLPPTVKVLDVIE